MGCVLWLPAGGWYDMRSEKWTETTRGVAVVAIKLSPSSYRCPNHGNDAEITAAVREKVGRQFSSFSRMLSSDFRVVVTCPGKKTEPGSAHERTFTGKWSVA